jgi:hypothetical protein
MSLTAYIYAKNNKTRTYRCISMATMVTQTRHNVTLYLNCLICLSLSGLLHKLLLSPQQRFNIAYLLYISTDCHKNIQHDQSAGSLPNLLLLPQQQHTETTAGPSRKFTSQRYHCFLCTRYSETERTVKTKMFKSA